MPCLQGLEEADSLEIPSEPGEGERPLCQGSCMKMQKTWHKFKSGFHHLQAGLSPFENVFEASTSLFVKDRYITSELLTFMPRLDSPCFEISLKMMRLGMVMG